MFKTIKDNKKSIISVVMLIGIISVFAVCACATTQLDGIVTGTMLTGVLDEIIALLPIVIPVLISFLALRKGISFLQSIIRSA